MSGEASAGKTDTVKKFQINEKDTGSSDVQVALLTERLQVLTEHFKKFPNDSHSQRGMMKLIARRKKLLAFLKRDSVERYHKVINALGLRK